VGASLVATDCGLPATASLAMRLVVMAFGKPVVPIEEKPDHEKGWLGPGQMLAVDLGKTVAAEELVRSRKRGGRTPYGGLLQEQRRSLSGPSPGRTQSMGLTRYMLQAPDRLSGLTAEDLDLGSRTWPVRARSPPLHGAMTSPWRCSHQAPLLYDYFKQRFAQGHQSAESIRFREELCDEPGDAFLGRRGSASGRNPPPPRCCTSIKPALLNERELAALAGQASPPSACRPLFSVGTGPARDWSRRCNSSAPTREAPSGGCQIPGAL